MFSHVTIGVNNLEESIKLYDEIMETLGHHRHSISKTFAGYGKPGITGEDSIWILKPSNGKPASGGNGTNIALLAPSRKAVDEFHTKAIELGAIDDGAPGIRKEAHDNFYAAYVIDFDGNKLVAVYHDRVS